MRLMPHIWRQHVSNELTVFTVCTHLAITLNPFPANGCIFCSEIFVHLTTKSRKGHGHKFGFSKRHRASQGHAILLQLGCGSEGAKLQMVQQGCTLKCNTTHTTQTNLLSSIPYSQCLQNLNPLERAATGT